MFLRIKIKKITLSIIVFWYNPKQTKSEYIIMQLAVIDDLIQESKSQIEQSEPCNNQRE